MGKGVPVSVYRLWCFAFLALSCGVHLVQHKIYQLISGWVFRNLRARATQNALVFLILGVILKARTGSVRYDLLYSAFEL